MELFKQPMAVFLLVVLAVCLFIQVFIYVPGTEFYENTSGLVLFPVYFVPIFVVAWFFYEYKGCSYVPFVVLACYVLNMGFGIKRAVEAENKVLSENPFVTVGLIEKFKERKTNYDVYFSFEDLDGKCVHTSRNVSDTTVFSDTILVLFHGTKPRYNKIYRKRPTEEELKKYKNGPLKLQE